MRSGYKLHIILAILGAALGAALGLGLGVILVSAFFDAPATNVPMIGLPSENLFGGVIVGVGTTAAGLVLGGVLGWMYGGRLAQRRFARFLDDEE